MRPQCDFQYDFNVIFNAIFQFDLRVIRQRGKQETETVAYRHSALC